ncbi:uncharacterized protein [Haliotis asinina]|uniref:uncharacterized protein n=1 Tax=Haliotis asinina TaxID=109174 RepID=UPI0035325D74
MMRSRKEKWIILSTFALVLVVLVYQLYWTELSKVTHVWIQQTSPSEDSNGDVHFTVRRNVPVAHDKWLILSTAAEVNDTRVAGWRVFLLESTTKSKSVCRLPWCVTMNTISRSEEDANDVNKAYIYAISHGASIVCLLHHLTTLVLDTLKRMTDDLPRSGLVLMTNKTFFEPTITGNNSHSLLKEKSPFNAFYIEDHVNPLMLSAFYPQMFRRSTDSPQEQATYSMSINSQPPIFLPFKTFTFLSSDLMVFQYGALWALPLMGINNGDLIAQRVLWDIGGRAGIYPLSVQQESVTLNTTCSKALIDLLKYWQCKVDLDALQCLSDLVTLMNEHQLVTLRDKHLVDRWVSDLRSIHYHLPKRSTQQNIIHFKKDLTAGILPTQTDSTFVRKEAKAILGKVCPKTNIIFPDICMYDIALIISFNEPSLYANIPLLQAIYRPYFHNIIFCGPNIKEFTSHVQNTIPGYFIYMELLKRGWYYMYECLIEAMKLNVDVKGFLQIGDDTLINPWNIYTLPRDKIWLHTGGRRANVSDKELTPTWVWWKEGKPRMLAVIDEIRNMSLRESPKSLPYRFLHNFQYASHNFTNLFIQGCDFMYVPTSFKENFTFVANLLLEHNVMVEIGFANIVYGLQTLTGIHIVKDGSLWDNRDKYRDIYDTKDIFLHPFKLKSDLSNESGKSFFCHTYLNVSHHLH